jgi:hypothetical protein
MLTEKRLPRIKRKQAAGLTTGHRAHGIQLLVQRSPYWRKLRVRRASMPPVFGLLASKAFDPFDESWSRCSANSYITASI